MRRLNFCHISFAFILKFLNFLQTFLGFSIILCSIWMFNQWNNHHINPPQPPAAPSPYSLTLSVNSQQPESIFRGFDDGQRFTLHAAEMVFGFDEFDCNLFKLPKLCMG